MQIRKDDLLGAEIKALLEQHLAEAAEHSPPESIHALDMNALRNSGISFWTIWDGNDLAGCGALQKLDAAHGEIKSMRTADAHKGKGVASAMLKHIIDEAVACGINKLSLETGSMDAYVPAWALYKRFGFEVCGPFADYVEDQYSIYMTRSI